MFVQVIQAKVTDPEAVKAAIDSWSESDREGAIGFLGTTGGISTDGEFFAAARFESEEAARANSDRPEQGEWWARLEKGLTDVMFHDCTEVDEFAGGGSDDAGFVQVIQGKTKHVARTRELDDEMSTSMRERRPDIIGGYTAWHPENGRYTALIYFKSEAAAREGEKNMGADPDAQKAFQEMQELADGEPKFIDLTDPWFA